MTIINYALALILTISLLVAVHEFGHYLVARLCGIKVLRFSIGFGKPLLMRRAGKDQTEYCISALPLGGYVKMLDEREGDVPEADRARSFNAQPVWQRIAVLLAGPAFNFAFAVLAYWVIFIAGMNVTRPVVGEVTDGSPAAQAGLRYGDVIAGVGGRRIESWQGGLQVLVDELVDDARIPLTVERAGQVPLEVVLQVSRDTARLAEPGKLFDGLGFRPWAPRAVVGEVVTGSAAALADVRAGDRIIDIDGVAVTTWNDVVANIRDRAAEPMQMTLLRDGETLTVAVTPRMVEDSGQRVAQVGIVNTDALPENLYTTKRYGVLAAVPAAVTRTGELIGFTLEMFGRMLTGSVSTKNISGPINIAEYAGFTLSRGPIDFLDFLALVSVSLGVLNLLPIPMLDGGQIIYQSVEGLTGKPLNDKWQLAGQQIGVFLLLGVMSLAFYNDIARIVERFLS